MTHPFKRPIIKRTPHPEWAREFWDNLMPLKDKIVHHTLFESASTGALSVNCIQKALVNFYPLVENFPKFMALNLAKTTPTVLGSKEAKYWLMENMEVEQMHSEWWRLWALGFGCRPDELENVEPNPHMDAINHYLWNVNSRASLVEGIAATNLAIEWPTGEWTKNVISGVKFYDGRVSDISERTIRWLEAHSKYDDEHPYEAMEVIKVCAVQKDEQQRAFKAAQRAMEYYLLALDYCYKTYNLNS